MKSQDLIVRCMARREGDVWVAVCLDYTLAAQGATLPEARSRLHEQIVAYVREAFTTDVKHAAQLLTRKAPLTGRVAFAYNRIRRRLHRLSRGAPKAYCEPLPLQPAGA